MLGGRSGLAVVAAFTLMAGLAACSQREGGAVRVMRSQDGAPSVAVTWCDDSTPRLITVSIEEKDSEKPVAKFSTTKGRDHFATLNLTSPGPDWTLLSGDPRLTTGITYRLMAWPGSGKEMGFGQSSFTLEDLNKLQPGQIAGGYPGETLTRSQFVDYANSICG